MNEEDFVVTTDGSTYPGNTEIKANYEEVLSEGLQLPVRHNEAEDQFEAVSKKLTAKSIGWKILNAIGFLCITSLLFFLVALIVTS